MHEACRYATFVDDFWLLVIREGGTSSMPPGLKFLNTKGAKRGGELVQTAFFFDPSKHGDLVVESLISDLGGHEPPHADDLFAPFYQDASQRVLAFGFINYDKFLVMKEEALLRLIQERKGEDVQWGEWEDHVTWVSPGGRAEGLWVSGPRICCVYSTNSGGPLMDTYDFSQQASVRRTETVEDGKVWRSAPSLTQTLPLRDIITSYGCQDSIAFILVRTSRSSDVGPDPELTEVLYVRGLNIRQGIQWTPGTLCEFHLTGTIQCRVSM
jgi:hypothetical protein